MKRQIFRNLFAFLVIALFGLGVSPSGLAAEKGKAGPAQKGEKAKVGGTLKIAMRVAELDSLDARQLATEGIGPFATQIYEGLVTSGLKGGGDPTPCLAERVETKDNKEWIFYLRKGVKFHNGREMTAEDVKANFDWRIQTPKGWKPVKYRQQIEGLQKAEVIDKYTVKVTLAQPFSELIGAMTYAFRAIIPPEEAEKHNEDYFNFAYGTGPFKLAEVKPKEKVVLVRNENYWGPKPNVDRIEYLMIRDNDARMVALEKGEVDFAVLQDESRPLLQKNPKLQWEPVVQTMAIHKQYFNMRRWPMNDYRFRKAVWMGADWKNIVLAATPFQGGNPVKTLLDRTPYENPEAIKTAPPYDPKAAKALIAQIEKEAGKKIPPIYYLDSDASPMKPIAEIAKMQLAQIGVNLDLHLMSHAIFFDKLLRDPKLEWDMGGYGQGFIRSPGSGLGTFATNAGEAPDGKSIGAYSNPEFDALLSKAKAALDPQVKKKIVQDMELILLRDAACIPLLAFHINHAWNKDRVRGVVNTDTGTINVTTSWGANIWLNR